MIEIPANWSQCEITAMSRRTRELVIEVLSLACFDIESIGNNGVKITPREDSKTNSFRSVIDNLGFLLGGDNIKFVTSDNNPE